ncbi:translation elongation factor [Metallosphaera hakonensis JCM 8857 = DSM 7519]|uniref:Translation elongation factor n=2 Tax=Metallosphaera hakonensis TaxID=79601 RepID=A0A2U9IU52_9CREN|nr:hypothetical protein [Metallosphaera hakonensis]AWR99558.1 translation elongation factor [Metallosphaera hakonensis JCM 8857 = DSM 7519]
MTVLARDKEIAKHISEKFGKLHEDGKVRIFYRRNGDYIRSILTSAEYPDKILELAEIVSLSSKHFVYVGENLSWVEGELALLATASGSNVFVVTNRPESDIRKVFKGTSLESAPVIPEPVDDETVMADEGVAYIDKAFVVKGVGVVVTGFSRMEIKVHDKLVLLPSMKETEVKSIQVLDEDQESVGPGIRIGLALRNVKEDEVKESYLMVKPAVKAEKEFSGKGVIFPWSQSMDGQFHFVSYGVSVTGSLTKDGDMMKITLNQPMPKPKRFIILNVNAKQGKPRVVGYMIPD